MDDNSDPTSDHDWLREMPLRSEEIGFARDEMTPCAKCGKPNAPNRSICLYCGTPIEGRAIEKNLDFRPIENWENGLNVVVVGSEQADADGAAKALASLLSAESDVLRSILVSSSKLPIARVEDDQHADAIIKCLQKFRFRTDTVSDVSLNPTTSPVRLRALTFSDEALVLQLFNTGDSVALPFDRLALIVWGVIFEGRTEATEKRKRGTSVKLSEAHTSSDTPVIDLYSRDDPMGWRITAHGFDFSCLGDQKSLLVGENIEHLIARLRSVSPATKFVGDYLDNRTLLEHCWPSESRRDAYGFQRSGFARKDLSSVSTTSNAIQITKYSRLQWQLL